MKKLIILVLLTCLSTILLNPQDIFDAFNNSINVCLFNLFPALFPFFIISNLLTKYGFIDICAIYGKKFMPKIFKVNPRCLYVLILSMLSGSPSNSKYIKQLLDNNLITINDAKHLLNFTHFVNPLFIIAGIGLKLLKSKTIGLIILTSHYFSGLLTGIILNKNYQPLIKKTISKSNNYFIDNLSNAIQDTIQTLTLILGIITSCFIFSSIINNLTNLPQSFFGLIEITNGISSIVTSNINTFYKTIIITFFISFGGFCIHMQVFSILKEPQIRYLPYLKARIIHSLLALLCSSILFLILHQFGILI